MPPVEILTRHKPDPGRRPGADDVHKSVHMHINFGLLADILRELAATVGRIPKDDLVHRDQFTKAVAELRVALVKV